jgi:hypothetical protein
MTDPNRSKRVGSLAPWPKGKPRNDPKPPKPYATMEEFWSVLSVELSRFGAKKELADYLGVQGKSLYAWITHLKTPNQQRVNEMGRWLRGKLSKAP